MKFVRPSYDIDFFLDIIGTRIDCRQAVIPIVFENNLHSEYAMRYELLGILFLFVLCCLRKIPNSEIQTGFLKIFNGFTVLRNVVHLVKISYFLFCLGEFD